MRRRSICTIAILVSLLLGISAPRAREITAQTQPPAPCENSAMRFSGMCANPEMQGASPLAATDQIWVMSADGSNRQQITADWENRNPAWSHTGTRIAFQSTRSGMGNDIYTMSTDGTDILKVTQIVSWDPAWMVGDLGVGYSVQNSSSDIYTSPVQLNAPALPLLTSTDQEYMPDFSPDAFAVAYTRLTSTGIDVWLGNADGTNSFNLTHTQFPRSASDANWSPSGHALAYTMYESGVGASIWVQRLDGSPPYPLTDPTIDGDASTPSWGLGGIAYTKVTGNGNFVYVMNADGTNKRNLGPGRNPDWSPDGTRIVFTDLVDTPGTPRVYVLNSASAVYETEQTALVEVTLNPPQDDVVTVDFSTTSNSTATPGVDFVATNQTLVFQPGETQQYAHVQLLDDSAVEPAEIIGWELSNPVGAELGVASWGHIELRDDESTLKVSFISSTYEVREGAIVIVTATLNITSTDFSSVDYSIVGGSAVEDEDFYLIGDGNLVFVPGDQVQSFSINVLADGKMEIPETVEIRLEEPWKLIIKPPSTVTITIRDVLDQKKLLPLVLR